MAFFTQTQATVAAGGRVYLAAMVQFDFAEGARRVWDGTGVLRAYGEEWIGSGLLGSISEIEIGQNDDADRMTFQLSGVNPEMVQLARQGESVRSRAVTVWGQFLDPDSMQLLDDRWVLRQMVMDTVGYAAQGADQRTISLTAETLWTSRNLAAFASWSDKDQKRRHPGDRGCEFIPTLRNKRLAWPTF